MKEEKDKMFRLPGPKQAVILKVSPTLPPNKGASATLTRALCILLKFDDPTINDVQQGSQDVSGPRTFLATNYSYLQIGQFGYFASFLREISSFMKRGLGGRRKAKPVANMTPPLRSILHDHSPASPLGPKRNPH